MFFPSLAAGTTTPAAAAAAAAAADGDNKEGSGGGKKEVLIPDTMGKAMEQLEAGRGAKGGPGLPLEMVDEARAEKERCVFRLRVLLLDSIIGLVYGGGVVVGWVGLDGWCGCPIPSDPAQSAQSNERRVSVAHTRKETHHPPTFNTHTSHIYVHRLLDYLTPPPATPTGAGRRTGAAGRLFGWAGEEGSVRFKALQLVGCFVGLQVGGELGLCGTSVDVCMYMWECLCVVCMGKGGRVRLMGSLA